MTQKERMLAGMLYSSRDDELREMAKKSRYLTRLINSTTEEEIQRRNDLFRELLGGTGKKFHIEPPFRCDYGCNIYIGESFYANFDCIILDVAEVHIGDNCFFGPRTSIYTPNHPTDVEIRNKAVEYAQKVIIGNNVWLGGNVVINPGVTIGNNVIIGSGSVVTHDIPDNVVAAGNPCKIIRPIK